MGPSGLPRGQIRLLAAVALAAAVATVFAAWAASQSTVLRNPDLQEAWRPAFVATYAAAGLYLWQLRRKRKQAGQCPECGYDLREAPDLCPECGTSPA